MRFPATAFTSCKKLGRFIGAGLVLAGISTSSSFAASVLDDGITAYRHGEFQKSANIFFPLAEKGNDVAQYLLSCQMINGAGIPADKKSGWEMMTRAANNQNPDASIVMARKLEATQTTKSDVRSLYQQAAKRDLTQAILWLALDAMDQGDDDDAKAQLERAWKLGDPRAATLLANRFTKSDTSRYQYLRAAAARGEMRAAAYLAEEARAVDDKTEAVGWCAIATGLPGHNKDIDWKTIGKAVEDNCSMFDKDLPPKDRAINRERVDQFLAGFFEKYHPWQPWRACAID